MKKILISGGSGFIGKHVVNKLDEIGFLVRILDKKVNDIHKEKHTIFESDILDKGALSECIKGCKYVYNFAGIADIKEAAVSPIKTIEKNIKTISEKARHGKLSIEDLQGGTFTISNGGVYGSMLSTPILNLPQSGVLGMHNIIERPVAINGEIKIRPIMYLALSYDHRIIDGKESVSFLKMVKENLEDPRRLFLNI